MTDVFTLLTLPKTSKAFTTTLRSTIQDSISSEDGSASPRRKTARMDTDSDAPSASRYKRNGIQASIRISVIGDELRRPHDGNASFSLLKRTIRTILTREQEVSLNHSYESIYAACRAVVTLYNKGEGLYGCLKIELEQSLGRLADHLRMFEAQGPEAAEAPGMKWIAEFVKACEWFEVQISLLQSLLTYLDQAYVVNQRNLLNTRTLAYMLFTKRIFEYWRVKDRLETGISEWANWERNLRLQHDLRAQIPALIPYLISHKQYSTFEEHYLKITRDFYTAESAKLAHSMAGDPKAFFKHAYMRIEEENQRSQDVLHIGSWSIVRETTEKALWGGRLVWLATGTLGTYINTKDFTTLAKMYSLFSRVDGVKALVAAFRAYIQTTVQSIVKDDTNDDNMVQRLLDFKSLADSAINIAFLDDKLGATTSSTSTTTTSPGPSMKPEPSPAPNDLGPSTSAPLLRLPNPDFAYALTDAFTLGFKARRNVPAEMIAKYVDKAMRRGQGSTSDREYEALLDAVLGLYRYTEDKDVFRTFYHRMLAKRLLLGKTASDDFESGMLKKLKENYDPEFGMGEEMFKDLALSREMMRDYHSRLGSESVGLKLTVMVLQRSAWPFSVQKSTVDIPPGMQAELMAYANYYKQRHSGHVLDWDHALGTVTIKARFRPGEKELSLSLYQGVILLLFDESDEWRYPEILERTRMDDAELRRTLQSLACGKKKVLKKVPPGRDVGDGDLFRFNEDFEDPRAKVHINSIQAKVSPEESQRTNISIEGDRKHYLDAAIVRIMKAKKEMMYEQLKAATIDAVKSHFVPQVDAIKKRIDALVEGDYLERSREDKNRFLYVA